MEENSRRAGAGNGRNQGNNRNRDGRGGYRGKGGYAGNRHGSGGKRSGGYKGHHSNDDQRSGHQGHRDDRNGGYKGKRDGERRGGYRGNSRRRDDRRDDRRHDNHYNRDRRSDGQGRDEHRNKDFGGRDDRRRDGRGYGSHNDDRRYRNTDRRHSDDRHSDNRRGGRYDDRRDNRRSNSSHDQHSDNRRRDERRNERRGGQQRRGSDHSEHRSAPRHGDMGGGMRERNQRKFDREEPKPFGYDRRKHRDVNEERAELFGTPKPHADKATREYAVANDASAPRVDAVTAQDSAAKTAVAPSPVATGWHAAAADDSHRMDGNYDSSNDVAGIVGGSTSQAESIGEGADASSRNGSSDTAQAAESQGNQKAPEESESASREKHGHDRAYDRRDDRRFDRRHDGEEDERPFYPEFFASCQGGLEDIVARELKSFGVKKVRPLGGGVTFYAEKEKAYKALLWSRTASRILAVIDRVGCRDADELYRNVRQMPWHRIIAPGSTIAVFSTGGNDDLRNSKFTNQKVKDAICDKIRQVTGERPDVDRKNADATISVRINRSKATISFDLTGTSLYQRSYIARHGQNVAVDVALANALLSVVNWRTLGYRRHYRLIDPVCNNPMVIVEAACEAADRAPGLTRAKWGFTGWGDHDKALWNQLLDEADERFENGLNDISNMGALALGISRRPIIADRAADLLKAAGVDGVGQVISVGEDAVGTAVDRAMHAANRAAESAIKKAEAENDTGKPVRQASVVAANLLPEHDADGLSIEKNTELFIRAAEQAPAGSTFAEVGGDLGAVYGHAPVEEHIVGGKRIDAPLLVFSKPPVLRKPITVVGLEDGIEHHVPVYEEGTEQFAARLRKIAKERRKWGHALGISCYRIYDGDLLDYMVAIDRYEDVEGEVYLTIAEYAAPATVDLDRARRRFEDVVAIAPVVLGVDPDRIFVKTRRQAQGGGQYRDAGTRSKVILIKEGGYTFEVDLGGRLDTGLFLDHRITRHLIEKYAQGKRFLNLFAYTGSATVYAAGGGARSTVTVDMSRHYLQWAQRNMERNGFEGRAFRYEHSDVMSWLQDARRKHRRFDLIFVDPPTFSNSKQMGHATWDVQRDHFELLMGVTHLLDKDGVAVFSCNLKNFKPDIWRLTHYGISLEDITEQTIPQDFERHANIHKCYLVRTMSQEERDAAVEKLERDRAAREAESERQKSLAAGEADEPKEKLSETADGDAGVSTESPDEYSEETVSTAEGARQPEHVSLELGTVPSEVMEQAVPAEDASAQSSEVSERVSIEFGTVPAESLTGTEAETETENEPARVSLEVGTVPSAVLEASDDDEPSQSEGATDEDERVQ